MKGLKSMAIVGAYMVPHPPLIIPEIGKGKEKQIKKTSDAYTSISKEISQLKPETIIISSPHADMNREHFNISFGKEAQGNFSKFGAPQVQFKEEYDENLVDIIEKIAAEEGFSSKIKIKEAPDLDHGTMVPLYFVKKFYSDFKIVRIGLSGLPLEEHYRLGQIIKKAVEKIGCRAVYIASGDLSHKLQRYGPYGFAKEGPEYDEKIMDVCSRAACGELFSFDENFCEMAAECGHRSFVIMAGALDGTKVEAKKLSYEDITGVGYGICSFRPTGTDNNRKFLEINKKVKTIDSKENGSTSDPFVQLAQKSIESYVRNQEIIDVPENLPPQLTNVKAGAFVSIHKNGELRGCIGTILPTQKNLALEIINNAVSAASKDLRFNPITPEELCDLSVNVDVLSEPEDIASEEELDVKLYGVIVTKGSLRGVLLPDLDGIDTVKQQISIAKKKAGIGQNEDVSLQRFKVVRHV